MQNTRVGGIAAGGKKEEKCRCRGKIMKTADRWEAEVEMILMHNI